MTRRAVRSPGPAAPELLCSGAEQTSPVPELSTLLGQVAKSLIANEFGTQPVLRIRTAGPRAAAAFPVWYENSGDAKSAINDSEGAIEVPIDAGWDGLLQRLKPTGVVWLRLRGDRSEASRRAGRGKRPRFRRCSRSWARSVRFRVLGGSAPGDNVRRTR